MTDRALTLLIASVVIVVLSALIYRAYFRETESAAVTLTAAPADVSEKPRTQVKVKVTSCKRDYELTEMKGTVTNTGNVDLHYVTVMSIWKNQRGAVIGTDTIYAVNGETLAAGESRLFEDVSELMTASRCNAEAIDWW